MFSSVSFWQHLSDKDVSGVGHNLLLPAITKSQRVGLLPLCFVPRYICTHKDHTEPFLSHCNTTNLSYLLSTARPMCICFFNPTAFPVQYINFRLLNIFVCIWQFAEALSNSSWDEMVSSFWLSCASNSIQLEILKSLVLQNMFSWILKQCCSVAKSLIQWIQAAAHFLF